MKPSHQLDKHVADPKKKRCRCDEEKTQAGSTTIPHLTAKKKRQPTAAKKKRQPTTAKNKSQLTI